MINAIAFNNSTPLAWGTATISLRGVPSIVTASVETDLHELRNLLHALDQHLAQVLELPLREVEANGCCEADRKVNVEEGGVMSSQYL